MTEPTRRLGPGVALGLLLALLVVTLLAYSPALSAGFIWDDDDYVTENPLLRDADGLRRIWTTTETPQYYPLVFTTFWIEHQLWGLEPAGYHAVNIVLHAVNAFLVGMILSSLDVRGAWWVAVLFAVHPVHVESVAWITERKNVLSALFYLLAFLCWLHGERSGKLRFYPLALVAFVAAMLSKTVAASLPVAMLLTVLWQKGRVERRDLARLVPFFLVGLALALVTVRLEEGMVEAVRFDFTLSWWQRVVVACRALLFYPLKILFPNPLIFNYPRWDLEAGALSQLGPVAIVLVVLASLIWFWRRGHRGLVCAGAFYAFTVFPALGFFNVYPFRYSFVADHFQYLASLGPLILLVQAVIELDAALARRASLRDGRMATAVGVVAVLVLGGLTWSQTHAYHDLESLWLDTISKNPGSWLAHNNLGLIRLEQGDNEAALEHLDRAIASKPSSAESHTARGLVRFRLGRAAAAIDDLDRAVELDPAYPQARLNRGNVYLELGRTREAIDDLSLFLERNPDYLPAFRSRARARLALGQFDRAVADFGEIIRRSPDFEAYTNRGVARVNLGHFDQAIEDFSAAIERNPEFADAYANRAFARIRLRRFEPALADLDRAIGLDPRRSRWYLLRGGVHQALSQDISRACRDWQQACSLGDCSYYRQHCN